MLAGVVTLANEQTHPVVADGIVNVPVEPEHVVPTLMSNAAVPLLAEIDGDVAQKPEAMVGAVPLMASVEPRLYPVVAATVVEDTIAVETTPLVVTASYSA